MINCPETTVLMRLSQFHKEELFDLAADFDEVHGVDTDNTHDPHSTGHTVDDNHNADNTGHTGHDVDHVGQGVDNTGEGNTGEHDLKPEESYVKKMWWAFHEAVGSMPKDVNVKEAKWGKISEKALSDAWEAVDAKHRLVTDHVLHISDSCHDETDSTLSKVDGSFIHVVDKDNVKKRYPNWADVHFLVEFKAGGTKNDPFDDSPLNGPDALAKTRIAVRGQLMSYAERVFAYQHRCTVFILLVNSDIFRVMRWDRSGVVVTEAINYCRTPHGARALLSVLHAFSKLSRAQLGLDTSAVRLVKDSCGWQRMDLLAIDDKRDLKSAEGIINGRIHNVFKKPGITYGSLSHDRRARLHDDPTCICSGHKKTPPVIPVLSHIREMFRESLVKGWPRYRLLVDGQEYLVAKHIFLGFGMVGRGTRGYVALEWKTQRFVFLKDCWRPNYTGLEKEADILAKLNANGVENIPTVVRYGDVLHTEPGFGEQITGASQYRRGGPKKVDTTLPPYEATVPPLSKIQEKLTMFVKDAEYHPPEKPNMRPTVSDPGQVPESLGDGPPKAGPTDPAGKSATKLNAWVPSNVTAPPPPTTGARGVKRSYEIFLDKPKMGDGLRHMIHTRLVVQEICIPLTAFTSSRQYVRILYECICAHAAAYAKCGYIHRDISAGNLLIYPEIVCLSDGRYGIYWRGLLADWELAKHFSTKGARQPQRTGTWHFMSAYLLLNPTMPTTIADDLESFLHVLIYGSIRRVNSSLKSIKSIQEFMNDYFAGCSYDNEHQQAACPTAKRDCVVVGQSLTHTTRPIMFSTPDGTITQQHPLNKLISKLLAIFHSRYHIASWEAAPKQSGAEPPQPDTALSTMWEAVKARPEDMLQAESPNLETAEAPDQMAPPTPQQYDNVEALKSHNAIARIFYTYSCSQAIKWPDADVVPDRLVPESRTKKAPRRSQASAAVGAPKHGVDPLPPVDAPEDVLMPDAEENDELEEIDSAHDVPDDAHSDHEAEDFPAPEPEAEAEQMDPDEPVERPAKRLRRDPVVQACDTDEPAFADLPMRRVTRSRSAANIAAAALAPVAAVPAAAARAAMAAAPAPTAAAAPTRPAATAVQDSMRLTRSKTGKLPVPKTSSTVAPAGASGAPAPKRGGRTRSTAMDKTPPANKPATRRRAAASQTAPKKNGGRRTRRS
ncbi:hypothetical protein OH76DRAFT_1401487 [Lentinus brumalis]|uniref:Fungal-type protein kinase domain-containing protein n=1 Tax=Lentinus brumalis TaxID=2498619 RepID=A0A371DGC0_9APHY|nr:hypothetical protein OH76DRAFT_1401487 [Polyporus brumalis]